jgi:uncharacterized repeat protein (TIGR02543 family)
MKKTLKLIGIIALAAVIGFFFTACEQPNAVTLTGITANYTGSSVAINTDVNSLKSYLTVTAWYSDNAGKTLNSADYSLSGNLSASGQKTVTVTYEDQTTTFTVTVNSDITYTLAPVDGEDGVTDTTGIVFTFSASVDSLNLTADDIAVGGAASKGAAELSGTGTTRTLAITANSAGTATVTIAKTGIEAVQKSVTIYKAWAYVPEYWSVTWNFNGGTAGTGAYPEQIEKDAFLVKPFPDPTKDGFTFGGWYTNAALTQTYTFADPVTANLNLYAKWETGSQPIEYWSVTWNLNGGAFASGSNHPSQIEKGAVLARPSPDPAKANNTFGGWYTDSGLTQEYTFAGTVTADLSLYAKWDVISATGGELNGTWVVLPRAGDYSFINGGSMMKFNNGNYETGTTEIPANKGTYTTGNGEISLTATHLYGSNYSGMTIRVESNTTITLGLLESKWYTKDELKTALIEDGKSEEEAAQVVNSLFSPFTYSYSISGNIFTIYSDTSTGSPYHKIENPDSTEFTVTNAVQWDVACASIGAGGSGTAGNPKSYTITVNGDVSISVGHQFSRRISNIIITIKGNGKLYYSNNRTTQLLMIDNNKTLIIDSSDLTIEGSTSYALIYVDSGTLELRNGTIKGGGGVRVDNNSSFTMSGGEISGSTSGGVMGSNSSFTMSGGEISGNTGGGVSMGSNSSFTMSGGEISGNTTPGNGGGVAMNSNSIFTMDGGKISGNTASGSYASGGGVFSATFTMNGGEISGNTASHYGGGVWTGGTFTMNGGEISGNTASGSGGGVYGSRLTMNDGEISNNTAAEGGGVTVRDNGTFTMNNGEISGNTAIRGGGGVSVDAHFIMNGGKISDNTANYGGGMHMQGGSFTMTGGTISGNTAAGAALGGGVYVSNNAPSRIVTGTIYGSNEGALSNTVTGSSALGAALFLNPISAPTAQRGTFNGETWISSGTLNSTDSTIRVVNGALQ